MGGRPDRRLLALVGLIAGLALVFVVLRMRGPGTAAPDPRPPEIPLAEPDAPPVVLSTPPAALAERTPLTERVATLAAPDTLVLEVVDEANAPVAGAEVHWRVRDRRARPLREDPGAATLAHTGADGRATLAVPRRTIEALARKDGALAEGTFEAPGSGGSHERNGRLVLRADWELPVEVVDAAENPVAAVELVLAYGQDVERTTTDARGLATFPHAGFALGRSPEHRLKVRVASALAGAPAATVDRPLPRGVRLRLQLPPVGSVEARVVSADGSPAPDGTEVVLGAVRWVEGFDEGRDEPGNTPPRAQTSAGRAVFEGIALGFELTLSVPGKGRFGPEHFRGPERPGERITRTVILPPERVALHLRAVDERGDPVAGELDVRRTLSSAQMHGSSSTSAHAARSGRFQVKIEAGLGAGERLALEISARGGALRGGIELDAAVLGEAGEEGTVVLHPAPLVVAGHVVDDAGRPIDGHGVIFVDELEARKAGRAFPAHHMIELEADGRFQLHGDTEATRVRLRLLDQERRSVPVEVPVGTSGVVIVAVKSGGVAGRLLLDPEVPVASLRLALVPAPDSQPEVKSFDDDGTFELVGATPGPHSFRVHAGDDVLAEIPDIEIVSGEIVRDPRLASIDLRGQLHVYRLDLVMPSAVAALEGRLEFAAAGAIERWSSTVRFRRTPVVVTTPKESLEVTMYVTGYRTERLSLVPGRTELHLRRAARVRLVLPRGVELPPPLRLGVSLALELWGEQPTFFDEHGEALCNVSEPGQHQVRLYVERRHEGGSTSWPLPNEQFIEVADHDDEQRFEIVVTNAELAAALAQR